jgi:hypothetical protein
LTEITEITPAFDRQRQARLEAAVKCLDELIIIVMERVAAHHGIDEEDLASACQPEIDPET